MPTGVAGSTFASELNRLANAGTYPTLNNYLSPEKAANVYAGTTNLPLIEALNKKVDANRQPSAYKALNAVCNEIAGTTNLSATTALRSINL